MAPRKNPLWSHEREVILIDFYRDHPFLWESGCQQNKIEGKSVVLDELVDLLGNVFTADEVQSRWISLRSTFRTNWNKAIASTGTDEEFVPSFQFYTRLLFLKDSFAERPPPSILYVSVNEDAEEHESNSVSSASNYPPSTVRKIMKSLPSPTGRRSSLGSHDSTPYAMSRSASEAARLPPTPSRSAAVNDELLGMVRATLQNEKSKNQNAAFASQVAFALDDMDDFEAATAMLEIQAILLKHHKNNPTNKK